VTAARTTSPKGLEFIAKWEGCVLRPYRCPAGVWTVGIGHVVRANEHFDEITREEAIALLSCDLAIVDRAIAKKINVALGQNQHDAIASWAFNVGVGPLANSGVSRALNSGDWDGVRARLLDWSKMRVREELVTNRGLYLRRVAESELFAMPDHEGHPPGWTDHFDDEERDAAQAAIAMSIDRSIRCYFADRE